MTVQMSARMGTGGELLAEEEHQMALSFSVRDEIVRMLQRAGFVDVTAPAAITDAVPTAADDVLVHTAHRSG